ncbi:hypothetical protein H9P43_008291 [Blastocladiella emersonii ATCC 22665]|nr:hypothetical protein H9P43_008291 [Blastocladiella emersonii ATCC 22665]
MAPFYLDLIKDEPDLEFDQGVIRIMFNAVSHSNSVRAGRPSTGREAEFVKRAYEIYPASARPAGRPKPSRDRLGPALDFAAASYWNSVRHTGKKKVMKFIGDLAEARVQRKEALSRTRALKGMSQSSVSGLGRGFKKKSARNRDWYMELRQVKADANVYRDRNEQPFRRMQRLVDLAKRDFENGRTLHLIEPPSLIPMLGVRRRTIGLDMKSLRSVIHLPAVKAPPEEKARKGETPEEKAARSARMSAAHWDHLIEALDGVLKPKILRDADDKNKYHGLMYTDGYLARKGHGNKASANDGSNNGEVSAATSAKDTFLRYNNSGKAIYSEPRCKHSSDASATTLASSLPPAPPSPRAELKVHSLKTIHIPEGKYTVWMDPGENDNFTALSVDPELFEAHAELMRLVLRAAELEREAELLKAKLADPKLKRKSRSLVSSSSVESPNVEIMPEVAKIAREVVLLVVLEKLLSHSVSSKTYHHQTLHDKMIKRRAMWREEAGMPEEDLKQSLAARGDLKKSAGRDYVAQAKALFESLDKRFAEEFHDRPPRMRFMVEARGRRWWSELAYSLRDAVVMLKAPVTTIIRELRAAGIPVYLVEENYSSKWCAACFFAGSTADNETFNLTGKS